MIRLVAVMIMILVISGLAVIYGKYKTRLVFIEIQQVEQELDYLEMRWERLTLEEKMLSEHNRVEKIARKKMRLVEPNRKDIIYIQL